MFCWKCGHELKNWIHYCPMCGAPASISDAEKANSAADPIKAKYPLALPWNTILAGQYLIENVLGQGGFGITYLAMDHKNRRKVAIKEFFPEGLATRMGKTTVRPFTGERGDNFEYGRECFLQEAETMAQFNGCKGIVCVHTYFEEYGTAYYVMDYIEGVSLDAYMKSHGGRLAVDEAKALLFPVMEALAVVHSKGVVHRDVAPDNILVSNNGNVKLLDFGAARYSLGDRSRSLDVVLKHGYAPKEQYTRRSRQGPYTDVYALGATFYYVITGKCPPDSIERIDDDRLIPPSALGINISRRDEEVLLTALRINSDDRYPNMIEFMNALNPAPFTKMRFAVPSGNDTVIIPQQAQAQPQQKQPPKTPGQPSVSGENRPPQAKYKTSIVKKEESAPVQDTKARILEEEKKKCRYAIDDLRKKIVKEQKRDRSSLFRKKKICSDALFIIWKNDVEKNLKGYIASNNDIAWEVFLILPCRSSYDVIKSLNRSAGKQIEKKYKDLD